MLRLLTLLLAATFCLGLIGCKGSNKDSDSQTNGESSSSTTAPDSTEHVESSPTGQAFPPLGQQLPGLSQDEEGRITYTFKTDNASDFKKPNTSLEDPEWTDVETELKSVDWFAKTNDKHQVTLALVEMRGDQEFRSGPKNNLKITKAPRGATFIAWNDESEPFQWIEATDTDTILKIVEAYLKSDSINELAEWQQDLNDYNIYD